jgi:hypothetical protein
VETDGVPGLPQHHVHSDRHTRALQVQNAQEHGARSVTRLECPVHEDRVLEKTRPCRGRTRARDCGARSATEHTRCLAMQRTREAVAFDTARSRSQTTARGVCTPVGKKRRALCVSDTCADGARVYYAFIQ